MQEGLFPDLIIHTERPPAIQSSKHGLSERTGERSVEDHSGRGAARGHRCATAAGRLCASSWTGFESGEIASGYRACAETGPGFHDLSKHNGYARRPISSIRPAA